MTGASSVKFDTTPGTNLTVTSPTQLTVTSPASTAGTVPVTVTTPGGTSTTGTATQYTYTTPAPAAPTVSAVSPNGGPTTGGTVVTITGTNLTGATSVKFGTATGTTLTVTSPTQLTVTSPAGTAGTVPVTVTTPGGTSSSSTATQYTYTTPETCDPAYTPVRHVTGSITTSTTWSPDCAGAYVLDETVAVAAGATLTLTPGTVVKSYQTGLTVNGALNAAGTSGSPVTFTSWRDDTVGGLDRARDPAGPHHRALHGLDVAGHPAQPGHGH
ncbi:IPT/TIG domain-containing protein [Intrasporangium mesophilum]